MPGILWKNPPVWRLWDWTNRIFKRPFGSMKTIESCPVAAADRIPVASKIRRWLAGVCLSLGLLMLALGMTVLERWLQSYQFLVYWSICIGLTGLAALIALADLLLLRHQLRHEQRSLIEETLRGLDDAENER
jgi:hypothetical protein